MFNKSFKHYWDKSEVFNYIGLCHYYLKNYSKAIQSYKEAVSEDPKFKQGSYYNNIGTAYVKNKQFKKALEAFRQYKKLNNNNGRVYRNYAMYYALQKQPEKAIEQLKKAIEFGYDDSTWLQTDDSMKSLQDHPGFQALLKKLKK